MKIRHVSQPDDTGCGLAVVAMITGKTYQEVKETMIDLGIFKTINEDWGTTFKDLQLTLQHYDLNTSSRRKFKKWQNIPAKVAIASTNYDKSGWFHWVVFIRDINGFFIYDPALRCKKIRDLRGKRSGHFIEINQMLIQ